jgi:predicted metal-binding protein
MFAQPEAAGSIGLACRDGREAGPDALRLRGMRCMSRCKRPCVVSPAAPAAFAWVFADLDPDDPAQVQGCRDLVPLVRAAPQGFLTRAARPAPLRASILGRLPPLGTASDLVRPLVSESPA